MTRPHGEERPIDIEGLPAEEGLDTADAVRRLEKDPDDQPREREESDPETVEGTSI